MTHAAHGTRFRKNLLHFQCPVSTRTANLTAVAAVVLGGLAGILVGMVLYVCLLALYLSL